MDSNLKKYFIYQLPWQALMVAIFIQSSMSQIDLPDLGVTWSDKILHFSVFGVLGWLVSRGFHHSQNKERQKKYFQITVLICIIYAATDEFHQFWVPGRFADIYDFFADFLGIVAFAWLYKKWHNGRKKNANVSVNEPINY